MKRMLFSLLLLFVATVSLAVAEASDIIAYNGGNAYRTANSLHAFKFSLERGVKSLHLQVVASKDHEVVLSENLYISSVYCKNMDGSSIGLRIPIFEIKAADLKKYDCGVFKNPLFPQQKSVAGTYRILLKDLFRYLKSDPKFAEVKLYIEMISTPYHANAMPNLEDFAKAVNAVIKENKYVSKVYLLSRDYRILKIMKGKMNWNYKVIPILADNMVDYLYYARAINAYGVAPKYDWINMAEVQRLHKLKLKVFAWGASDAINMNILKEMKVDGIIASDPFLTKSNYSKR